MPGKVNPTQAEAMLMVTIQILGNDTTIAMAGKEGNFELNTFRPVIIANLLHSMRILADMCHNLRTFMIEGAQLNTSKITEYVDRSVMMVTALAPVIGYDKASAIAHTAIDDDLTLKQAALKSGVSEELFDRVVVPIDLTKPGSADQS
jgi:fumarate hydratase class II